MFVQMFTGRVTDAAAVRGVFEGWPAGAGREAVGWLGSTAGVTDDGTLVALVRFASQEEARTLVETQDSNPLLDLDSLPFEESFAAARASHNRKPTVM